MRSGWALIWALAIAQLVSWGSLYYSFSLFVVPMEAELGWSRTTLDGALSLGLLVAGLLAYPVGAWIDRHGGRAVMSLGSLSGAALLWAWSSTRSPVLFYALWFGLGWSLAATLYEPVFAVITRRFPQSYRLRITALTLVGGFASTVFIPLTQLFIDVLGWRHALLALSVCNIVIALPVHALLLYGSEPEAAVADSAKPAALQGSAEAMRRALRHRVFWGLAVSFTLYYATFSAMTFHIIPLLSERAVPTATIVGAIAVIGPAQVLGRVGLLVFGTRISAALAGRLAFAAFPAAVILLLAFPASLVALFAFAVVYGAANGVITIVRGLAVPDLLWREGYGAINGALTLPANIARAAAPFGAALIWRASGSYDAMLWSMLGGGAVSALAFWFAAAHAEPAAERERR
jgi:predicted MFS family arabinose efflux permease